MVLFATTKGVLKRRRAWAIIEELGSLVRLFQTTYPVERVVLFSVRRRGFSPFTSFRPRWSFDPSPTFLVHLHVEELWKNRHNLFPVRITLYEESIQRATLLENGKPIGQ